VPNDTVDGEFTTDESPTACCSSPAQDQRPDRPVDRGQPRLVHAV